MTTHSFEFASKFRRHAFGWRSQLPIQRIKEAVRELRHLSRKEPILAAEGAVLFLEKLSGALERVDSSSGAIGNAVNQAIDILVPLISKPVVAHKKRQQWLKRLWEALEKDDIPYLEANQNQTNLAAFRTLTQKYPYKQPLTILRDLIASRPGEEGKWFAAAKSAGFFDLAIELVSENPTDPRTLIRAAKEFSTQQPHFAIAAGIASLRWIREGYGYEISSADVHAAYAAK